MNIGVGAQSVNFGWQDIFAWIHFCLNIKYITYVWEINKMPEFYMIFAQKIFFSIFCGGGVGHVPPLPLVSYAYMAMNGEDEKCGIIGYLLIPQRVMCIRPILLSTVIFLVKQTFSKVQCSSFNSINYCVILFKYNSVQCKQLDRSRRLTDCRQKKSERGDSKWKVECIGYSQRMVNKYIMMGNTVRSSYDAAEVLVKQHKVGLNRTVKM